MGDALDIGKAPDIIPLVGRRFHLPFSAHVGKGSRKPQQCMEPEETEGPQEQGGHPPEGDIKNRIFRLVVVGGVGQITRETPVCIGMAFLAGLDHLIKADMGIRIVHPQDIMGPVAVGTFGRFQVSQPISLAVHRIQVGLTQILVAFPALIGHFGQELVLRAHLDFMGGVAILAGRQLFLRTC